MLGRMREGAVLAVASALLLAGGAGAQAQSTGSWDGTETKQSGEVDEAGVVAINLLSGGTDDQPAISVTFDSSGRAVVTSNLVPVDVREIRSVPAEYRDTDPHFDGACILTHTIMVIRGQEGATRLAYEEAIRIAKKTIFPGENPDIPPCVAHSGPAVEDPVAAFEDLLESFVEQLPRPTPVLNPEAAITGLDTYLQTNRPLAYGPVNGNIRLGGQDYPVTLWAEGAYTVDWGQEDLGEGEAFQRVTGPHTIPGRNYESGRSPEDEAVTHVYTTKPDGELSVSVTDYWIVHYSIAGVVTNATLVAQLQPVSVPVEVREYQAVVVNE